MFVHQLPLFLCSVLDLMWLHLRIGIVLGFVLSYRTTTAIDKYNEGRRLWNQIILATRNFSRMVWLHIPGVWHVGLGVALFMNNRRVAVWRSTK